MGRNAVTREGSTLVGQRVTWSLCASPSVEAADYGAGELARNGRVGAVLGGVAGAFRGRQQGLAHDRYWA